MKRTIIVALLVVVSIGLTAGLGAAGHQGQFEQGKYYVHEVNAISTEGSGEICVDRVNKHTNKVTISRSTHSDTSIWNTEDQATRIDIPKLSARTIVVYTNRDNALVDQLASSDTCTTEDVNCQLVLHAYYLRADPVLQTSQGLTATTGPNVGENLPKPTDDASSKASECGLSTAASSTAGTLDASDPVSQDMPVDPDTNDAVDNTTNDTVSNITDPVNETDEATGLVNETVDTLGEVVETTLATVSDAFGGNGTSSSETAPSTE